MNQYDYIENLPPYLYNALRDQRQNDWNSNAAAQYSARVQQDAMGPQFDQSDVIGMRDWTNRQMGGGDVGWSRMGDEVYIGGQRQSLPEFQAQSQARGVPVEDLFNESAQWEQARRAAASQGMDRYQTFASNPMLRGVLAPQVDQMYEASYGMGPLEERKAQYAAAAAARADLAQELDFRRLALQEDQSEARQMTAEQKAAMARMRMLAGFYGAHPGEIVPNYDPRTQMAKIPGKYYEDDLAPSGFKQGPPRELRIPMSDYEMMRQGIYGGAQPSYPAPPMQSAPAPAPMPTPPPSDKPKRVRQNGVTYTLQPDGTYR